MFHEIAMLDASRGAWDGTQVDAGYCVVKESRHGKTASLSLKLLPGHEVEGRPDSVLRRTGKHVMKLGGGYVYTECEPGDAADGHATSSRADSVVCGQSVDGRIRPLKQGEPESCTRYWYTKDRLQHRGAPP